MRCVRVVALLLTGSSAVLSAFIPLDLVPPLVPPNSLFAQINEIATKCPHPVVDHIFDIIGKFQAEPIVKNDTAAFWDNAPLWVDMAPIAATCEIISKTDLTPRENGTSHPPARQHWLHHKSFFGQVVDIATKCPKQVLDLTLNAIDKYDAELGAKNATILRFDLTNIPVACELLYKKDLTPRQGVASIVDILTGPRELHPKSPLTLLADIATKCPKPVLEHIPEIIGQLDVAHKADNDKTPLWVEFALLAHTCEILFQPNFTAHKVGPSNSSTHLHHLFGRQSPEEEEEEEEEKEAEELELGKRYTPSDQAFLAKLSKALFERRWAFFYDGEGFWTSHVAKAVTHRRYEDIYTMDQERKIDRKNKKNKANAKAAQKAERKRIKTEKKAAKKAAKKAEKEALKKMTHEERKKYKADKKANEKLEKKLNKESSENIKKNYKVVWDEAVGWAKYTIFPARAHVKDTKGWEDKLIGMEKDALFENGGGPAIGDDNDDLEYK